MKLSVIVIAYDMHREIPRTLQSLTRNYQLDSAGLDYEVLVIDNSFSGNRELLVHSEDLVRFRNSPTVNELR